MLRPLPSLWSEVSLAQAPLSLRRKMFAFPRRPSCLSGQRVALSSIRRRLRLISFDLGCSLEKTYLPWLRSLKYLLGWSYFSLLQCWLTSLTSLLKCQAIHLVPMCRRSTQTMGFGTLLLCLSLLCVHSDSDSDCGGGLPVAPQVYCRSCVDRERLSPSCGPLLAAVDF